MTIDNKCATLPYFLMEKELEPVLTSEWENGNYKITKEVQGKDTKWRLTIRSTEPDKGIDEDGKYVDLETSHLVYHVGMKTFRMIGGIQILQHGSVVETKDGDPSNGRTLDIVDGGVNHLRILREDIEKKGLQKVQVLVSPHATALLFAEDVLKPETILKSNGDTFKNVRLGLRPADPKIDLIYKPDLTGTHPRIVHIIK